MAKVLPTGEGWVLSESEGSPALPSLRLQPFVLPAQLCLKLYSETFL